MTEARTLRQLRTARGLTQQEAAAAMGVIQASYSAWETGRSFPAIERLPSLARMLDVDMETLVAALLTPASERGRDDDAQIA